MCTCVRLDHWFPGEVTTRGPTSKIFRMPRVLDRLCARGLPQDGGTVDRTLVANRLCQGVFGTSGVKPEANDVYDVWYAIARSCRSAIPQDCLDTESGICCNK